jgi:hypothetical protein
MRRSLKTMLLWLLIAVLPLQGLAAVMLHGWTAPAAAVQPMDHAAMAMPMSVHEACMDAPAAGDPSHHSVKHGCSAAATCCAGAAVPPGFPILTVPPETADVHVASVTTPVAGHIPDGLERPPRSLAV